MKTRDFSNSAAPVLRDPSSGMHVAPPLTGGAQVARPLGHPGAFPNPSPSPATSSAPEPQTTPAPAPGLLDGLSFDDMEAALARLVTSLRSASQPSEFDRLVWTARDVLRSPAAMATLVPPPFDQDSRPVVPGDAELLAARVVAFADALLRRAATLVGDREADTRP